MMNIVKLRATLEAYAPKTLCDGKESRDTVHDIILGMLTTFWDYGTDPDSDFILIVGKDVFPVMLRRMEYVTRPLLEAVADYNIKDVFISKVFVGNKLMLQVVESDKYDEKESE